MKPTYFLKAAALGLVLTLGACATTPNDPNANRQDPSKPSSVSGGGFTQNELVQGVSTHLGVTSESAASLIERLFRERGVPSGYITGQEGGGAVVAGVRYGKGTLWMKDGTTKTVYWQGPTVGWDFGADASKVFTLVYNLNDANYIYQRFPGVDGSAFLVGGMAVNYQRANGVTLAPVRSGVGVRLGAKVGYTSYTRKRNYLPF